ncbi:MAG: hypothetical protein HFI86_09050 [Bacilli bacterium]|nr:hypothetical protein [Bacilli bacterium]
MIYKRPTYEEAKKLADDYISKKRALGEDFGIEETDISGDYLLHDLFIYVVLSHGTSQFNSFHEKYSIEKLLECHRSIKAMYEEEVSYLHENYKARDYEQIGINFYITGAYVKYGLDETYALDIVSTITGISQEELIKLKKESRAKLKQLH